MLLKIFVPFFHIKRPSCSSSQGLLTMDIQSGDNTLQMQSAYAKSLQQTLKTRQDLVLDFTNLKACLDPLAEYANQNAESNGQEQQTQVIKK